MRPLHAPNPTIWNEKQTLSLLSRSGLLDSKLNKVGSGCPSSDATVVAPSTDAVTSSTFVAPTVPEPAPRTRPSVNLSSVTLSKLLQSEISQRLQSTPATSCRSCMPSSTTVCRAQFTLKLWGIGQKNPARTGLPHPDSQCAAAHQTLASLELNPEEVPEAHHLPEPKHSSPVSVFPSRTK